MSITITWHLILMLVISLAIIVIVIGETFKHGDWSILTIIPLILLMGLLWAIYGGIVWW